MAATIEVNSLHFIRNFAEMKHLAISGVSVRVVENEMTWVFVKDASKDNFLGCTKGTLKYQAALEKLFCTDEM